MKILSIRPEMGLPGGIVRIEIEGMQDPGGVQVTTGGEEADILSASPESLMIRLPVASGDRLVVKRGRQKAEADFKIGRIVADGLHSVGNPVVDSLGNVFVTYSGARGENVPYSVFVIYPDGSKHPFLAEITNPTGMAIGPDKLIYISSRHTSAVYRTTFDKQVEKYLDGLGLATGLTFDSSGNLYVGDRSGTIYKVNPAREISVVCELEPSISAFHLAMGPDGWLYVTAPTLATQDCVYRVSAEGKVEIFFKGLGRPQGLGFDPRGRLQVTASFRGRKGLFTFENGSPELTVSGPMLVGMAYDQNGGNLYLVDHEFLYQISPVAF